MFRIFLMRFINWQKVRGLGSLQILNKASYIMIIFVPILASFWPSVRFTINRYNNFINETRLTLEDTANKLEKQIDKTELIISKTPSFQKIINKDDSSLKMKTITILDSLNNKLDKIVHKYNPKKIDTLNLPDSWARSFFAALSIILAHLFYQIFSPDSIRKQSAQEFVRTSKNDYASNQTDGALRRSSYYLNIDPSKRKNIYVHDIKNISNKNERLKKGIELIEMGAFSEYRILSIQSPIAIILSAFFYLCGVILILSIIWQQSLKVAIATGWL